MITIRKARMEDAEGIYNVYKSSAKVYNHSLTQNYDEIKLNYIKEDVIKPALDLGLILVAENEKGEIVGSFKSYTSPYRTLAHVMSNTTFVSMPNYEGRKAFVVLINKFFETIKSEYPHIKYVDGVPHSSNTTAINEYLKVGYKIKGKIENKILDTDTKNFDDEIIIIWTNPNFKYEKLLEYHKYCSEYLKNKYSKQL